ncbi:hypothetical protein FRB93_003266 [Tulasnella sp. JGI-2019a]|nr:hypothetical protein FRB93_003266 [Tulasnella sp. JGI-2019a]
MTLSGLLSTWKLPALILTCSQAIPSLAVAIPTSPHPIRNTVHSTDPRIVLVPKSSCTDANLDGSDKRFDPWYLETYADRDGVRHSYYRTSSWGNYPESTDQIRGISFGFRGTSLKIYGAPYRQILELGHVPGKQEVCLPDGCQEIDAEAIYDATSEAERDSPVLLWSHDGLPDNRHHRLDLRLLDPSWGREQTRTMTIHHMVYKSRPALPSKYQLASQEHITPTAYYGTSPWRPFFTFARLKYTQVELPIDSRTFEPPQWWMGILLIGIAVGGVMFYCISVGLAHASSKHGSGIAILSTPQQNYNSTSVSHPRSTPLASTVRPGSKKRRNKGASITRPRTPPIPHTAALADQAFYDTARPAPGTVKLKENQKGGARRHPKWMGLIRTNAIQNRLLTPSAAGTETAIPIPSPPPNEVNNHIANATIKSHPHLFAIVTPINAGQFQRLLSTHPNKQLVKSMIQGLREGFWPFAITEGRNVPDTVKYPNHHLTEQDMAFVRRQRDEEINLGRYSSAFGPNLLPGMQTSPIGVVPKPRSEKLRMVVDQSAGEFALNSYVSRSDAGIRLDSLSDFGQLLLNFHKEHGRGPRWIFKTDVSQAYRRLPAHPLWQIKQVITIDGKYHVNRCIDFGGRGSGKLWCLFFGLVVWVAIRIRGVEGLCHYVDDAFAFDDTEALVYYAKYDTKYPSKQVLFLQLLDDIGCPHDKPKQLFFPAGTILGFHVDPQSMTITLPDEAREDLAAFLRDFTSLDVSKRGRTLREWLKMLGWCNWALDAYPLLRPALQSSHKQVKGKRLMSAEVMLNESVKEDLNWFADRVEGSNGVRMLKPLDWLEGDADVVVVMCDACMEGLGFWDTKGKKQGGGWVTHGGFFAPTPAHTTVPDNTPTIHYFEALCVATAIVWYAGQTPRPEKLLIYTDSTNSVNAFNTMRAKSGYNAIAKLTAEVLLNTGMSLRVLHIPEERNTTAKAISRQHFQAATRLVGRISRNSDRHRLVMRTISLPPQLMS